MAANAYKKQFWIFLLFFEICPNFEIFSMAPLLSAKYSKVKTFLGKRRDTNVPLHIVFIAGMHWYAHENDAWKSGFYYAKICPEGVVGSNPPLSKLI